MPAMPAILATTLPFFALVLCGHLAARQRLLAEGAIAGLNGLVLGVYLLAAAGIVGLTVRSTLRAGCR